jgi:hypothetical protein
VKEEWPEIWWLGVFTFLAGFVAEAIVIIRGNVPFGVLAAIFLLAGFVYWLRL